MESKINTLELDYVWVIHTLTQCELRTRIYIVLLICTQPTPHRLNEVNILHISKREAFRCLAIFLYNISLERIVCYLTYKMFYDCLIWSILTLLIIRNMKQTLCVCNAVNTSRHTGYCMHGYPIQCQRQMNNNTKFTFSPYAIKCVCFLTLQLKDYRKRSSRVNAISQGKWFCMSGISFLDGLHSCYALGK